MSKNLYRKLAERDSPHKKTSRCSLDVYMICLSHYVMEKNPIMTLILTVATHDKVVQASDRRLVKTSGSLVTDNANKNIIVIGNDSRFVISYTGLANVNQMRTDVFLARFLVDIKAGQMNLEAIQKNLLKYLTNTFLKITNINSQNKRLTVVLSGFHFSSPFYMIVSNFESLDPIEIKNLADPEFHSQYYLKKKNRKKALIFGVNGREEAMVKPLWKKFRHLHKTQFFYHNDSKTIAKKLVWLIRKSSETKMHGDFISKSCMTVILHNSLKEEVQVEEYKDGNNSTILIPHLITPTVSFIEGEIDHILQ